MAITTVSPAGMTPVPVRPQHVGYLFETASEIKRKAFDYFDASMFA